MRVLALLVCGAATVASVVSADTAAGIGGTAQRRASAQGKLSPELSVLAASPRPLRAARSLGVPVVGSRLRVVFALRRPARSDLARAIEAAGGRVEVSSGTLLEALVPPARLRALSADSRVVQARRPFPMVEMAVGGEGVAATNATAWQRVGLTGAGVKIAIVDGGFGGLSVLEASGEVSPSAVKVDDCGGSFDAEPHGTAVAEIVSEEAPAAQLYLICVDSEVGVAAAEAYAKAKGIQIISHSIGWFDTARGDGTGPPGTPDATAADAHAHGILWVNAAGNEAMNHWSGRFTDANGDGLNDFAPGDQGNEFLIGPGGTGCAFLRWDDWPVAHDDYDLEIFDVAARAVVASSNNDQRSGRLPPVEETCYRNPSGSVQRYAARITVVSAGKADDFDLFVEGNVSSLRYATAARSIVDPATSPDVLAAGAICWQTSALEPFSSEGPTIDGRTKPDFASPDGVSSATYGPSSNCTGSTGFAGTSAAAPYLAGAAALVKQRFPSDGPDQIRAYLRTNATDLGPPGADDAFGAGRLLLPGIPPPSLSAVAASGRFGKKVRLTFRAVDDASDIREQLQVFRGSTVVKTIALGFASARAARTFSTIWRAPRQGRPFRFCVQAFDRGGTPSARSCAPIRLSR